MRLGFVARMRFLGTTRQAVDFDVVEFNSTLVGFLKAADDLEQGAFS